MQIIPLYSGQGDWAGIFHNGHLFNQQGEWIGWVLPGTNQVYSVVGDYVGWLSNDFRVLRKRSTSDLIPRRDPPTPQPRIKVPASVPLAPMMAEQRYDIVDVFEEMPDRLHTRDFIEETRADMD